MLFPSIIDLALNVNMVSGKIDFAFMFVITDYSLNFLDLSKIFLLLVFVLFNSYIHSSMLFPPLSLSSFSHSTKQRPYFDGNFRLLTTNNIVNEKNIFIVTLFPSSSSSFFFLIRYEKKKKKQKIVVDNCHVPIEFRVAKAEKFLG